jgi:hypothetical protein
MTLQNETKPSLIGALAKALPELESAKKNKANPAFKSKYADLAAIIDALEPLTKHGLWYRQVAIDHPDGAAFETFYIHESGDELSAGVTVVPVNKKDAQGHGSAQSYARRYALQAAFGLATEDDDGNAASKSPPANDVPKKESAHSALKNAVRGFVREMEACADWDMWCAFRDSKEARDVIAQVQEKLPEWWDTGIGMPEEFVPLRRRIEMMEANFANQIADIARV